MATLPSPAETAQEILSIFVTHLNCKPNDVLQFKYFFSVWRTRQFRDDDYKPGIDFAVNKGWIDMLGEGEFRLTASGFAVADPLMQSSPTSPSPTIRISKKRQRKPAETSDPVGGQNTHGIDSEIETVGDSLSPTTNQLQKPISIRPFSADDIDLPDIFTPGDSLSSLYESLSLFLGTDLTKEIVKISKAGIKTIEDGDFKKQAKLGKRLIEVAGDFPKFHASGLFFAAEGYRLMADIAKEDSERKQFRDLSKEYYTEALYLAPEGSGALRGLGRLSEISGDYDEAMRLFEAAQGFALAGHAAGRSLCNAPGLAHEILRSSRHRVNCILGIMSTDPQSKWHREVKQRELIGEIAKSDDYHQKYMRLFGSNPKWMYIEGFMAMVFLAKAWGYVGDKTKSEHYFLEALYARRKLFANSDKFTEVERSNLNWWISNVQSTKGLSDNFMKFVDQLSSELIKDCDAYSIFRIIDNLIEPVSASRNIIFSKC